MLAASVQLRRVLFRSDGVDGSDNLLPTIAHVLESGMVLREHEAGVDKAKARAVCNPGKGPRDDRVQPGALADISLVSALPRIHEALIRHHLQHLPANETVPRTGEPGLQRAT